jgi:multidrug resistance efflux pump
MDMKDEIVAAKKAIDDVRISIQELTADRGTLQAQLDVAVRYGDTVRADQLRAEIAKKDGEIADTQAQIKAQEAKLNKTLVGSTAEAIANRAQVLALVQSYAPYIEEILATTKDSSVAKKKIASLKQQATDRLLSLGFSASEITKGEFTKSFDDMLTIVTNKPRDITL